MNKKRDPLLRLFYESRECWAGWIILLFISFLSGWFSTETARLTGKLIDEGISAQYADLKGTGAALAVILALNCLRTFLNYFVNARTTERMFLKVRRRMYAVMTLGKMEYVEGRLQTGEVVSRLNNDVGNLCDIISGRFVWYLRVLLEAAVALAACIRISRELSVVYLIIMPVSFLIMNTLSKKLREKQKRISVHTGSAASVVSETLHNISTVKIFGMEEDMHDRFAEEAEAAREQETLVLRVEAQIVGVRYCTQIIQLAVLFVMSILYVSRGLLTPGSAIAFITVCTNIRIALELSDQMVANYQKASALTERIYEILDIPVMDTAPAEVEGRDVPVVDFEDVRFSYGGKKPVLRGVDFQVLKGQRVGIVGPSGCGKSTLIKLICKFYGAESGRLSVFGKPMEEWSEGALYDKIALVGQEAYLFGGTVFENVRNGREGASRQEVEEVLKRVQMWEYVDSLENGMDTDIGEGGSRLSGGQAQRLSIARALLKDAELVLLDEPTASLDVKTEYELKKAFEELLDGRTALIVTHRYAVIENADYIFCIDKSGRIAEQGTPASLLERRGYYYSMYRAQKNALDSGMTEPIAADREYGRTGSGGRGV